MVEPRNILQQHPQPQTQCRHISSSRRRLAARVARRYWRIASQWRSFTNIAICFRDQAAMLPLQCSEAVARLDDLRRAARSTILFLSMQEPETTRLLHPYASIDKLTMLDYQLTELILCIAMLAPVCQVVSYERVGLHLYIRSLFPRCFATFEDSVSQLAVLMDTDRSRQTAKEGGRKDEE